MGKWGGAMLLMPTHLTVPTLANVRAARTAEVIALKAAERHQQSLAGVCQELFSSPESEGVGCNIILSIKILPKTRFSGQ